MHRLDSSRCASYHGPAGNRGAERRSLGTAGLSFHEFCSGVAQRIVPQTAELRGSMRTLTPEVRQLVKKRVSEVAAGIAQVTGAKIDLTIQDSDAVVFNHAIPTDLRSGQLRMWPAKIACSTSRRY